MCDEHTEESNEEFRSGLSRRGAIVAGAAVVSSALLAERVSAQTPTPDALPVVDMDLDIDTPDGKADVHFATPAFGKHPAVLVWPDIMGLRPAFRQMGRRLAESGYAVLTINPFYRKARGEVFDATKEKFTDPPVRAKLMPLMQSLNADTNKTDALAMFAWLDKHDSVNAKKKAGTTGYCMGGPLVMRTAAYLPDRIGAGCTFHGGGIATNQPTSPHLLVPQYKAKGFLCAVAQNDDQTDPESKNRLKEAFAAKKIKAEVEVYAAQHGWCPPDSQVYDKALAEKAWGRMLATFKTSLV